MNIQDPSTLRRWCASELAADAMRGCRGSRRYMLSCEPTGVTLSRGPRSDPHQVTISGDLAVTLILAWPEDATGNRRRLGAARIASMATGTDPIHAAVGRGVAQYDANQAMRLYESACQRAAILERHLDKSALEPFADLWLDGARLPFARRRPGTTPRILAWESPEGLEKALAYLEEDAASLAIGRNRS